MSAPFRRQEDYAAISEINVVPLADVSLVLLIILLLLSPMMTQNMLRVKTAGKAAQAAEPPEAPAGPAEPELVLAVSLGPAGLAVGDRLFAGEAEFSAFMKEELAKRSDRKVFLAPHPEILHGLVVETIEIIRACGAESVALVQTQDPPEDHGPL